MKQFLALLLIITSVTLSACEEHTVRGTGDVITSSRTSGAFAGVNIQGSYKVEIGIKPGKAQAIKITTYKNLQPLISATTINGVLYIKNKAGHNLLISKPIKIDLIAQQLSFITLSGASELHARNINTRAFRLSVSGASETHLAGSCDRFDLHIRGAAKIKAKSLTCNHVQATILGAAKATVTAKESVLASIKGAGELMYAGKPKTVRSRLSGSSSLQAIP